MMASMRSLRRSDGYSFDRATSGHHIPALRARSIPHLVCAAVLLLSPWLPCGVTEACDPSIISATFDFNDETALSTWDIVGQCENGCCCGPSPPCVYANGTHIWFDGLRCTHN